MSALESEGSDCMSGPATELIGTLTSVDTNVASKEF